MRKKPFVCNQLPNSFGRTSAVNVFVIFLGLLVIEGNEFFRKLHELFQREFVRNTPEKMLTLMKESKKLKTFY